MPAVVGNVAVTQKLNPPQLLSATASLSLPRTGPCQLSHSHFLANVTSLEDLHSSTSKVARLDRRRGQETCTWRVQAAQSRIAVRLPTLIVSTGWKGVDVEELSALLAATKQNCEQFPGVQADGSLARVDHVKLRRALQHSFVVVTIRVRGEIPGGDYLERAPCSQPPEGWLGPWLPQPNRLIAFGRATSDHTLTASIYDLAVAPSLQGQGVGRRLIWRIIRELTRQGISDISVLSSPEQRPFFEACGFGPDVLGSTSMVYTARARSTQSHVKQVGRNLLLVPAPLAEAFKKQPITAVRQECTEKSDSIMF